MNINTNIINISSISERCVDDDFNLKSGMTSLNKQLTN